MMKRKNNFIDKLINIFGIKNVRTKAKSLKGKLLVGNDKDEDDKPIYVHSFKHVPLVGAIIKNGKDKFRVIVALDGDDNTLMEKYKRR